MDIKDKRFIEETFPIREVSVEGAKEKSIRHGHISTLHIWWARRPLATSRATNLAALIPVPDSEIEKQKTRNFIAELSKWENSNNETLFAKARKMILDANGGVPPKVLDPFGGGGSIPLEALRLGCETYSNDYNPVAVLIQKCTLEYPQKYGKPISLEQYKKERPWLKEERETKKESKNENLLLHEPEVGYNKKETVNPLLEDVKYWGNRVLQEAKKEIKKFYPADADGATIVGYIWARTILCQNPTCRTEIPLMRQFWLSNKDNKKVVLYPFVRERKVQFKIVGGDFTRVDAHFDPENGTISRAVVNCPVCGSITDDKTTRKLFQQDKASQRMVAVVTDSDVRIELKDDVNEIINQLRDDKVPRSIVKALQANNFEADKKYFSIAVKSAKTFTLVYNSNSHYNEFKISIKPGTITIIPLGKAYRLATDDDITVYNKAEKYLQKRREHLMNEWGIDPIPDEELPLMSGVFNVPLYGLNKWGKLFNGRQVLAVISFCNQIRKLSSEVNLGVNRNSILAYLGLNLDRTAIYTSNLGYWHSSGEKASPGMQRQALGMVFDYLEAIPTSDSFSWSSNLAWILNVIENNSMIELSISNISNASATKLPFNDNFLDAVFTDPPYYNSVPYADLSDFFYVWLKRSIGDSFTNLFSTPLSPKANEITEMAGWDSRRYPNKDKNFFEENLKKSFQEIQRVLKPKGLATIVYAHKSTSGWETVINALLDSGLVITASYPLNTEMQVRLRANDSATLSSSIYIIARKLERKGIGFYNEVKDELKNYLNVKLDQLWGEGIIGADFFIAAIGSAIEVFGKYEKVMDYEGDVKRANVLLDDVREIVMNYTISHILHNGFSGEVSELTKFYVICRFSYGEAKLEFDEANKLARSVGIDLSQEFNKRGFVKKENEFVRLLSCINRKPDELKDKNELIDVLHHTLLLWEAGKKEQMMQLLADTGFGQSEAFFRVAQAISESLAKTTPDSREKKLLDGFLGGKERIKSDIPKAKTKPKKELQGKLDL